MHVIHIHPPHSQFHTLTLLVHSIQTALQILLQTSSMLSISLLRSWVLSAPRSTALRHGNLRSDTITVLVLSGLDPDLLSEHSHFVQNHFPHLADILYNFEIEVEGSWAARLVRGIVPDMEVGVFQSDFDGDSGGGIECEHLVEEGESIGVGIGEEHWEGLFGHEREVANVFLCTGRANASKGLLVGCTKDMKDLVELIDVISAFEEWSAS